MASEATIYKVYSTIPKMGLQDLPNELLFKIMGNVPTLPVLLSLIRAYPSLESLYDKSYRSILSSFFATSGMPLQLQKLMSTSMSARRELSSAFKEAKESHPGDAEIYFGDGTEIVLHDSDPRDTTREYLNLRLEGNDTLPLIGEDSHPIATLTHIARRA